jgi:hypothetical protein
MGGYPAAWEEAAQELARLDIDIVATDQSEGKRHVCQSNQLLLKKLQGKPEAARERLDLTGITVTDQTEGGRCINNQWVLRNVQDKKGNQPT